MGKKTSSHRNSEKISAEEDDSGVDPPVPVSQTESITSSNQTQPPLVKSSTASTFTHIETSLPSPVSQTSKTPILGKKDPPTRIEVSSKVASLKDTNITAKGNVGSSETQVAGDEARPPLNVGSDTEPDAPRQVIAVSASKGPAAFFNLARKFLATDEMCDLSALEGAIVSAIDAAHLLERSKLATIVRIQTAYVAVEPKRKKIAEASASSTIPYTTPGPGYGSVPRGIATGGGSIEQSLSGARQSVTGRRSKTKPHPKGSEMRRARIIITVKRTEDYRVWLDENQAHGFSEGDDVHDPDHATDILEHTHSHK